MLEHLLFHGTIPAFNDTRLLLVFGGVELYVVLLHQLLDLDVELGAFASLQLLGFDLKTD